MNRILKNIPTLILHLCETFFVTLRCKNKGKVL